MKKITITVSADTLRRLERVRKQLPREVQRRTTTAAALHTLIYGLEAWEQYQLFPIPQNAELSDLTGGVK